MPHCVEKAFEVKVYHIYVAVVDYPLIPSQCIMATSSRTEAVAVFRELVIIDWGQYLVYGLLHQTVNYCGYSQEAHLAFVFGYLYPPGQVRAVCAAKQGTNKLIPVSQKPWEQMLAWLLAIPPHPLFLTTAA